MWNEKSWRALSPSTWGCEARGYDAAGKLVYRLVFAPGEDVHMVCGDRGVVRLATRAVYFDADGRPDWTVMWNDVHRDAFIILFGAGEPDGERRTVYKQTGCKRPREVLRDELEAGLPQPWNPQPIDGKWESFPRRGLVRFERAAG